MKVVIISFITLIFIIFMKWIQDLDNTLINLKRSSCAFDTKKYLTPAIEITRDEYFDALNGSQIIYLEHYCSFGNFCIKDPITGTAKIQYANLDGLFILKTIKGYDKSTWIRFNDFNQLKAKKIN